MISLTTHLQEERCCVLSQNVMSGHGHVGVSESHEYASNHPSNTDSCHSH